MIGADVYIIVKEAATKWPDNPAVFDQYGSLSFSELFAQTESFRLQLLDAGIGKGMVVGIKAHNSRNFIISLFAVIGCGATAMPVSHQLKKPEIDEILEEAQLHAILDDGSGIHAYETPGIVFTLKEGYFNFNFTGKSTANRFAPHVANPAFMRFTSGTTGKSKGVIISHEAVLERIDAANKGLQLNHTDTVIWVLPMAYHFVVSVVLYIRFGTAIAIAKDFLAKNIIDITNRHNGTLLYASPLQIRLLANDKSDEQLPSLKKVISTSAAISMDVCTSFKNRFNIDVSQAYGIIEIGLPMLNYIKSAEHPDAVGYALPDYQVDILDDDYQPLPAGSMGHLAIKGPGMFDAYLNPPASRNEILKNGYFLTADYATKADDGLIKVVGRLKSVINISGIKIFPEEIEGVLESYPGIKLARITSNPHPLLGEVIEGEIVLQDGASVDTEEVLTYCRKRLSAFKTPQKLKIVPALPETGSGKLMRY